MLHFIIMFVVFFSKTSVKIHKNPYPVFIYFKIKCVYMLAFTFFIFLNCDNKKPPNTKKRQALWQFQNIHHTNDQFNSFISTEKNNFYVASIRCYQNAKNKFINFFPKFQDNLRQAWRFWSKFIDIIEMNTGISMQWNACRINCFLSLI